MRIFTLLVSVSSTSLATLPSPRALGGRPINVTRPVRSDGTIALSNTTGSIVIVGWEKPELAITGSLGNGVERLDVSGEPDRTDVQVILKRESGDGRADLMLYVPHMSHVDIKTVTADTKGRDLRGTLKLVSVSGDVVVEGRLQEIEAKTVSGDTSITGVAERAHLKTTSGDVEISGGGGEIEINTVSGDMKVSGGPFSRGRVKSVSGDFYLSGDLAPGGSLEIESHSGNVTFELSSASSASFDASTFSGKIEVDGVDGDRSGADAPLGRQSRFSFGSATGRPGARATIKTFSGDIHVKKR